MPAFAVNNRESVASSGTKSFFSRIVSGVSELIDKSREQRISAHAELLYKELARQRDGFNYDATAAVLGISSSDSLHVRERVYLRILHTSWKDGVLSGSERRTLDWAASKLELSQPKVSQLNWDAARHVFGEMLTGAIKDGEIGSAEAESLRRFAAGIGTTVPNLMQGCFREQGQQILQSLFASATIDGRSFNDGWHRLTQTAYHLGFSHQQLLDSVAHQARGFVEHVLADAKSDGILTAQEDEWLTWLLQNLALEPTFRSYVEAELNHLRLLGSIAAGKLPVISNKLSMELKAGEIPHFLAPASLTIVKQTRRGPQMNQTMGDALVTDVRMIFSSAERSMVVNHRNVVQILWAHSGLEVRTSGKGAGCYNFGSNNQLALAIWRTAVGRANQTVFDQTGELPTRHIPREVRQRVWQLYGGRCAQCQSDQYLEFDHIIPVAKGGSNHESNVQLLCRKCNLKKSDSI